MKTKLVISFLLLFGFSGFYFFKPKIAPDFTFVGNKIKGLSFVASPLKLKQESFAAVRSINADWISLMPYSFLPNNSSKLKFWFGTDTVKKHQQWWGETPEGVRECIKMAHNDNLKVMVKPHVWIGRGEFTGDLDFKTKDEWRAFESSFSVYILNFANIAEAENAEMFCFATEMKNHVKERPDFWFKLIKDIKKVYHGPITYAENWDSYADVPFWKELDFIGVDGYFPLSKLKDPSETDLKLGWQKHLKDLGKLSSKEQKPVLFTELGYRSCDYATEKPWETNFDLPNNENVQSKAYAVFFEHVWGQKWFAGVFIWKWFPDFGKKSKFEDTFTPQNKKGELVLKSKFAEN